jgi:hypothetical protein
MGGDGPKHHARSEHQRRVTIRFGLKVGVFGVLNAAHAASGLPNPSFHFVELPALLCIVLALASGGVLLGNSLSYCDEASWFLLIACLG